MEEMWLPETVERKVRPTVGNKDGGSIFDDQLDTQRSHDDTMRKEMHRMADHLNQRSDHSVYVGSAEEREKMRQVFNWWKRRGYIDNNPNIRIDYAIPEGNIRIDT